MTNKLTKKDFYNSVIAMADGNVPAMTMDEIKAAAQHELDLLAKKAGKAAGPNPDDAPIKAAIMEFLADHADAKTGEIGKATGYSTQKLAPRLKALVNAGEVTSKVVKGSTLYSRA